MKITKQYLKNLIEEQISVSLKERGAGGSYRVGAGEDKKVILAKRMQAASKAIRFGRDLETALREVFDAVVAVHPEVKLQRFHK